MADFLEGDKMLGNVITSPTFRFLKVNDVEIEDIDIKIPSWNKADIIEDVVELDKKFDGLSFGVNDEIVRKNREEANFKAFLNIEGKREEKISFDFSKEKSILFDQIKINMVENSKGRVLINYSNVGDLEVIRNSVIYVYSGKNSELDLYVISKQNSADKILQSLAIVTEEKARVNLYHVELGAKFNALSVNSFLEGDDSRLIIQGIYFSKEKEKLDLLYNTKIKGKNCKNHTKISGVQKDNSHKTFKGTIDFKKGSSGSVGDEEEYVTLLDGKSISRSLPIILCSEEDVRGNHAANVGKIDQEMLFYIMSRGLSLEEATTLIVMASLSPVIDKVPDQKIREEIEKEIYKSLV